MSNQNSTTTLPAEGSGVKSPPPVPRRRQKKPLTPERAFWARFVRSTEPQPETEEEPLSFRNAPERLARWLRGAVATAYGISLAFHAVLLLVMSLIVLTELNREEHIQTSMREAEPLEMLEDVLDVRVDMPEGDLKSNPLESAMKLETFDDANSPVITGIDDSMESLFEKEGAGGAGGAGFLAPKDARVFTKGSFSAWTVPNNPDPGQDYEIVIVVRLPDRVKRYQANDLKGIVVGTDGYRQEIPGIEYTRGRVYLPLKDQTAQLVVRVPGAAAKVRDKIEIRSTTLNEKQTLEIEF